MAGVRRLRDALPQPVDHVIAAIQGVTDAALGAIADAAAAAPPSPPPAGGQPAPSPAFGTLRELVRLNHCLLNALGVGHAALDDVVAVTAAHGFASKLTGAGGGGCAFTLLPAPGPAEGSGGGGGGGGGGDDDLEARVAAAVAALQARGFDCFETSLGGDGLLLLRR